jgi:hypothetical protein
VVDLAEYVNVIPKPKRTRAAAHRVRTETATDRKAADETGNLGALRPGDRRKNEGARQENEAPENSTPTAGDPSVDGAPRGGREKAFCRHF